MYENEGMGLFQTSDEFMRSDMSAVQCTLGTFVYSHRVFVQYD